MNRFKSNYQVVDLFWVSLYILYRSFTREITSTAFLDDIAMLWNFLDLITFIVLWFWLRLCVYGIMTLMTSNSITPTLTSLNLGCIFVLCTTQLAVNDLWWIQWEMSRCWLLVCRYLLCLAVHRELHEGRPADGVVWCSAAGGETGRR